MGIRKSEEFVYSEFRENDQGWPTGGRTQADVPSFGENAAYGERHTVLLVDWQDGIVGEDGQNGAFVEDVLEAARQRLQYFQSRDTSRCRENAIALTHIETALAWLDFRTRARLLANVENSYGSHEAS